MPQTNDDRSGAPSHIYYYSIGTGTWRGRFSFRIRSWIALWRGDARLVHKLLALAMVVSQRLLGESRLYSQIKPKPDEGPFGIAENTVKLSRLGVTLYLLRETYVLDPDGRRVTVKAWERFGPIPYILVRTFTYPAEIHADGMASTYHMPLLGTQWTATYQVSDDRERLSGVLRCEWAEAKETARRER